MPGILPQPAMSDQARDVFERVVFDRFVAQFGEAARLVQDTDLSRDHAQRAHAIYAAGHLYLSVQPAHSLDIGELTRGQQHAWLERIEFLQSLTSDEFRFLQECLAAHRGMPGEVR